MAKPLNEMTLEELREEEKRLREDRDVYREKLYAERNLLDICLAKLARINQRIIELLEDQNAQKL